MENKNSLNGHFHMASGCDSNRRPFTGKRLALATALLSILNMQMMPAAMAYVPDVNSGETINGDNVSDEKVQNIHSGGVANHTVVSNSGLQIVKEGGTANNTSLDNYGKQVVNAGGTAIDTQLNDQGIQYIDAGGVASGTIVNEGGYQNISGIANNTVVNSGGNQLIEVGGVSNNSIIHSGSNQDLYGADYNSTIHSGAWQMVYGDAVSTNTTLNGGQQNVLPGGITNGTIVNAGGIQHIYPDGIANGTIINTDSMQFLNGIGTDTIINNNGQQHVGSIANGTTINDSGQQFVWGIANNTTINDSGEQHVEGSANDTIINGGTQYVFSNATATNTIANAGQLLVSTGGILSGNTQINGTAILGGDLITNQGTLSFNPGAQNTVETEITGTGSLVKNGSGTLILNAVNTYSGSTTVSGGSLLVGGCSADSTARINGDVDVQNGAALGGFGKIAGRVSVRSGGTLSPGNSIGTLTVAQAHFASGSTFTVDIAADGRSDKLVADSSLGGGTGSVQIDTGANLFIKGGAGTWNDSTSYTIIDTDGGVSGTFTGVTSSLAFLTPTVDYSDPLQVNLTMTRNETGFADVGGTYNQRSTGAGIESLGANSLVYQQILSMDGQQARNAYDNLSGEIHASVKSAILTNSRYARNAVNQHLSDSLVNGQADGGKTLWVNTWTHDGDFNNDGNATRLNNNGFGLMIGADAYSDKTTTVGLALGYEQSELKNSNARHSKADLDGIHLLAYGKTRAGAVDIKGGIGHSWLNIDSKRQIAVGSLLSANKADYDGSLLQAFVEGSHTVELNQQASLTPYAGLTYQRVKTDSFTETADGSGAATRLHQYGNGNSLTTSTLGIRGNWRLNQQGSQLYADLGWQHAFSSKAPDVNLSFSGGSRYNIRGVEVNKDSAVVAVGGSLPVAANMVLSSGYEGLLGNQSTDHAVKIRFEMKF